MKRLLIATLLISMGAYAEEEAEVLQPAEASVETGSESKEWPTLDDWWKENRLDQGTVSAEILLGYEYSDLSGNATKAAHGVITRTRLNYQTANYEGFDGMVQAQYVGSEAAASWPVGVLDRINELGN